MSLSTGSVSFGSSNNSSYIPDYQEEPLLNQLAQIAGQLGQQQYKWAGDTFAGTSALTDQAISQYLDASSKASQLAGNNLDRYQHIFQPMEDQLVQDANTYASGDRTRTEMGQAEAGAGVASDANRVNAEKQLQSYGIDPSSGRYAELEQSLNAQRGAQQAQAGLQARQHTEDTGRQLRGQAIQVGQQYPGQIVNTLNSQVQALSGAVNSKLANANTGANLFDSANKFLGTGMNLKYPPLGTRGGSSQNSQSGGGGQRPSSGGSGGGGSRGGGSSGGGFQPSGPSFDPAAYQAHPAIYRGNGAGTLPVEGGQDAGADPNGDYGYGNSDPYGNAQGDLGASNDAAGNTDWGYGQSDPYGGSGDGWGGGAQDAGGSQDNGGGYSDTGGYDNSGSYDGGYGGGDVSGGYSDTGGYDSGQDTSGGYSDTGGYDFAAGGAIPDETSPTTGGYADPSMSPSGGQQTDDIPAHLNANEYVIPRDVALWKGQEFFQKLIDGARKARQGATAQGQPSNKPVGQPAFVSQGA